MLIKDRVYGEINITEPIILELLDSYFLRRLAGIDQCGYTKPFRPASQIINRLEHSIGVYWLLKKYKAPLTEQVAGLIHDISHSAFSHTIDYVLADGNGKEQNYQDHIFADFIRNSDIPSILHKYGIDLNYILNDGNFPLKEKELPDLCADRIDYSFRTAIAYGEVSPSGLKELQDNLIVKDQAWIFKDLRTAKKFADLFRLLNTEYYTSPLAGVMHDAIGNYLHYALNHDYLEKSDLYTTDQEVLNKITLFHKDDPALADLFARANNKLDFKDDPQDYDKIVYLKSRLVDPLFLDNGKVKRLSQVIPEWQKIIKEESGYKTIYLKFL